VPELIDLTRALELDGCFRRLIPSQIAVEVDAASGEDADGASEAGLLASGKAEPLAAVEGAAVLWSDALGDAEDDGPPQPARTIARTPTRISLRRIRHLHALVSPVPLSA
jgi:hypothetical protein